jgi:hypothetical protein
MNTPEGATRRNTYSDIGDSRLCKITPTHPYSCSRTGYHALRGVVPVRGHAWVRNACSRSESRGSAPALPEMPTIAESGPTDYNSVSWIGVLAPAGTAPTIVERIAKDLAEILARPDVREKLVAHSGRIRRIDRKGQGALRQNHRGKEHYRRIDSAAWPGKTGRCP